MSLMNGVVIGLVTDVNGKGMVKVKFPWLPDEPETDWIRIATTMAGSERGTFFMPEKKDEVLIAFEHGDTNHPYVIGFLWNGQDKPPEKDKNIRKIKTKSGHTIEFNDNSGDERIHIKTAGEHEIEIKDSKTAQIWIKTKRGQEIKLNDDDKTIILKTGEDTITMGQGSITIDSSVINLNGETINIEAKKRLKAQGNPIHLNP